MTPLTCEMRKKSCYIISQYKNEIYGASIIWIMLFHAIAILDLDYAKSVPQLSAINALIGYGNMGVEIFVLCSGVYLYFSFQHNKDSITFMKKRLERLLYPVIIIESIYWIYKCFISPDATGWVDFCERILLLRFWLTGDQQIYYVSLILLCYILYPYIYSALFSKERKNNNIGKRCILLIVITVFLTVLIMNGQNELYERIEIAITRIPIFIFGCYLGKMVYDKKPLPRNFLAMMIIATIGQFVILHMDVLSGIWRRYFYFIGGVAITFLIPLILDLIKCNILNRFLAFFGKISLNLYLSHILVIYLYRETGWCDNKRILHYFVILLVSILIAYLTELIIEKFKGRLNGLIRS